MAGQLSPDIKLKNTHTHTKKEKGVLCYGLQGHCTQLPVGHGNNIQMKILFRTPRIIELV